MKKNRLTFILLAALFLLMVAPFAQAQDGFVLADRIAQKVANGEPLVIRVSYHDVSNEFAPQIKAGVEKA
ncbi:MAG: hypothetical protein HXY41_17015, partial [Chloroflexi bacterium]|nr:hypothetical protein [Chloroflexota bacterium]